MKKNELRAALVVFAGVSSFAALAPAGNKSGTKGVETVFIPSANVKWHDVPGTTGAQMAPVDGDPSKGPSHFFLKFAGGLVGHLHHHTADHFGTVVSGTLVLSVDGKDQKLPPGSFFALAGNDKHINRCEPGPDCVLLLDVHGTWDVVSDADKAVAKK